MQYLSSQKNAAHATTRYNLCVSVCERDCIQLKAPNILSTGSARGQEVGGTKLHKIYCCVEKFFFLSEKRSYFGHYLMGLKLAKDGCEIG